MKTFLFFMVFFLSSCGQVSVTKPKIPGHFAHLPLVEIPLGNERPEKIIRDQLNYLQHFYSPSKDRVLDRDNVDNCQQVGHLFSVPNGLMAITVLSLTPLLTPTHCNQILNLKTSLIVHVYCRGMTSVHEYRGANGWEKESGDSICQK